MATHRKRRPAWPLVVELREAAALLSKLRAADRQLSAAHQASIGEASWGRNGFGAVAVSRSGGLLFRGQEVPSWSLFGFSVLPPVVCVYLLLRRRP